MLFNKNTTAAAAMLFMSAALTQAHMIMREPAPYQKPVPQVGPLDGGALAYPCQRGVSGDYTSSDPTVAQAGSNVNVAFIGSAVHGGGSCQMSLFKLGANGKVTDNPSDWHVILSIEGGCPADAAANLPTTGTAAIYPGGPTYEDGTDCTSDGQKECAKTYAVPIDSRVPAGDYVFAWSWFNAIGNREMYMDCAPLKINSASTDDSYLQGLPSMFTANIPKTDGNPNPCTTTEGGALTFPNPGANVLTSTYQTADAKYLGTCPKGGAGSSSNTPASYKQPAAAAPAAPAPAATTPAKTTPPKAKAPTVEQAPADAPPAAPAKSGCNYPCSSDGTLSCISSTTFGICDHGCMVAQKVAAGTKCQDGKITKRRGTF